MDIERRKIESSLKKKGFVEHGGDHQYFHHELNGKRTGAYTFTSRGSKYQTYGVTLLKKMKDQLLLDSLQQVCALFNCPMDGKEYIGILRCKGIIPQDGS